MFYVGLALLVLAATLTGLDVSGVMHGAGGTVNVMILAAFVLFVGAALTARRREVKLRHHREIHAHGH